ncbi:MAG: hypothetical protein HN856_05570 [Gammaproteobacteria bacterium]|jgi:hypothetical protein|nr:hypothetical protein [Gammaproteobacteria bacterium]
MATALKSYRGLLGILAAGIVFIALLIWWVGPAIVRLAIIDERRNLPFTQLSFARAEDLDVYRARFQKPLASLVASEQGVMLDSYHLVHVIDGEQADEWPILNRTDMLQATDLVNLVTGSPYRLMQRYVDGLELLQLGGFVVPASNWRKCIVVIISQSLTGTGPDSLLPVVSLIDPAQGQLVWDTPVIATQFNAGWDRVVVVDFAEVDVALNWLRSAQMVNARAISSSKSKRLATIVFKRD